VTTPVPSAPLARWEVREIVDQGACPTHVGLGDAQDRYSERNHRVEHRAADAWLAGRAATVEDLLQDLRVRTTSATGAPMLHRLR
jgi:hypothetical protein